MLCTAVKAAGVVSWENIVTAQPSISVVVNGGIAMIVSSVFTNVMV